ncbi:MAG: peptidase domain-containing ABC transporter, partial [Candidatus Kapaibacteriota bacterium]
AGIAVLEQYVVDVMQRRIFVRTAFDVVSRLPQMQRARNATTYTPELVNRFFDVMTVQKSIAKFLLEGVRSILMLLVGLILLALYHPFFLVYDLLFVLFIPVLVFVLGRRAIDTAVVVSKRKYQAAAWIEDVARNQQSFKLANAMSFAYDRIDSIGGKYVDAKHRHFIILARQILGTTLFKAFATVGVLGLGGILVIEQQISLGQLVAAEIIIIMILGAIEKILGEFDTYYDFIAALDKLAVIAEQPLEPIGGMKLDVTGPLSVELDSVSLTLGPRKVLQGASTHVPAGGRLSLVGQSGSGKSTILNLISGIYETDQGTVRINGRDVRELDIQDLRQYIGYVLPEDSIVEGTVRENILLGRDLPDEQLEWALAMTHLQRDVRVLPHGIETMLYSGGDAISYGMRRRILLARVIVHQPRLLLIDEAFDGIEDAMKLAIIQELVSWKGWTVINVSHDPELVRITPQVCVLSDGVIKEHGTPQELAATTDSIFATLFPLPSVFDVRNDDRQEGRHA